ncbi:hypothetical protein GOB40_13670 [Sinorhizobium meliloti]|nr:hypothetical protein [Sinorhizobium meliloti]
MLLGFVIGAEHALNATCLNRHVIEIVCGKVVSHGCLLMAVRAGGGAPW